MDNKRFLAIFICLAMLLCSLVGCNTEQTPPLATDAPSESVFASDGASESASESDRVIDRDAHKDEDDNGRCDDCGISVLITFDFYGNYDYVAPEGGYKYVKLELNEGSRSFVASEDPNQVVWTLAENWNTVTLTVTADCNYIEFYYNVADGQHGDPIASWIMMDNFVVVKP